MIYRNFFIPFYVSALFVFVSFDQLSNGLVLEENIPTEDIDSITYRQWLHMIQDVKPNYSNNHRIYDFDQANQEINRLKFMLNETTNSSLLTDIISLTELWVKHFARVGALLPQVKLSVASHVFKEMVVSFEKLLELSDRFWSKVLEINKHTESGDLRKYKHHMEYDLERINKLVHQTNLLLQCATQKRLDSYHYIYDGQVWCDYYFDGAFCWHPTPARTFANQSCGIFNIDGQKKTAFKYCDANGQWYNGAWNKVKDFDHLECANQSFAELKQKSEEHDLIDEKLISKAILEYIDQMKRKILTVQEEYSILVNRPNRTYHFEEPYSSWLPAHSDRRMGMFIQIKDLLNGLENDTIGQVIPRKHGTMRLLDFMQFKQTVEVIFAHYAAHLTYVRKADQCINKVKREPSAPEGYCPAGWGERSCWPATPPAQVAKTNCPNYSPYTVDDKALSYRYCQWNGSWLPENQWECSVEQFSYLKQLKIFFKYNFSRINYHMETIALVRTVGSTCSIVSILLVLLYWFRCPRYESPWNLWNYVHIQFLLTCLFRAILALSKSFVRKSMRQDSTHALGASIYPGPMAITRVRQGIASLDLFRAPMLASEHFFLLDDEMATKLCRLFAIVWQYSLGTNYAWMMIEAIFMTLVLFSKKIRPVVICSLSGWLLPIPVLIIWAYFQSYTGKECWDGSDTRTNEWIVLSFHQACIVVSSVLFLAVVVRLGHDMRVNPPEKRIDHMWFWPILPMIAFYALPLVATQSMYEYFRNESNGIIFVVWFYVESLYTCCQGMFISFLIGLLWWQRKRNNALRDIMQSECLVNKKSDL